MTPRPVSTAAIAAAISARRSSMSSSGPIEMVAIRSCGPTTCTMAVTNSSASRPCVTRTRPIISVTLLICWPAAPRASPAVRPPGRDA
ncbi:hypothetical protein WR25_11113 [Diploscapter pachys]|uniref:Uncharacterized protein n=1 Tax=Diploscapter pachys TaxID=2018661 RepID=A0A2A2KBL4_9BILA|nr:hypothetical protein WR25_11113 [Diploscapter pachys]